MGRRHALPAFVGARIARKGRFQHRRELFFRFHGRKQPLGNLFGAAHAGCSALGLENPFANPFARGIVELIEPAARTGRTDLAAEALKRLARKAHATRTDWALGIDARSRALLSEDDRAEDFFQKAIDHLSRTGVRAELSRTHLLYGEWLRRMNRRVDARAELRIAYDSFASMGMAAFAERAERELSATGDTVRKRTVETRDDLTAQERQIAELARDGLSNPEIGARLFLSRRTVEWHLRHVFAKLEIQSRRELSSALAQSMSGPLARVTLSTPAR